MSRAVADQVVLVCDGAIVHVPQPMAHGCPRRVATARPQLAKADNAFQCAFVGQPTEPA